MNQPDGGIPEWEQVQKILDTGKWGPVKNAPAKRYVIGVDNNGKWWRLIIHVTPKDELFLNTYYRISRKKDIEKEGEY